MGLERITEIRKAKGITVEELSKMSGVPMGTLSKISAGITKNPNLETVRAIAIALDCSLDDFDDSPRIEKAPAETGEGKYKDIIELLDKLEPMQLGEVKGYINCLIAQNEAAEAAKQIKGRLADYRSLPLINIA